MVGYARVGMRVKSATGQLNRA